MAMPLAEEFDAEEVIEAVQGGDRYAFEELVRVQGRWVRGVVFGVLGKRECVDDVCQQVWTAVWQRIGELRDVRSWRGWLYRMARNHAIDAGRDLTRQRAQTREVSLGRFATTAPQSGDDGDSRPACAVPRAVRAAAFERLVIQRNRRRDGSSGGLRGDATCTRAAPVARSPGR